MPIFSIQALFLFYFILSEVLFLFHLNKKLNQYFGGTLTYLHGKYCSFTS